MRLSCFTALAACTITAGCAPPDPVDLADVIEPSVDILFPVQDDPSAPYTVELTSDCFLEQLVVVDVDGVELIAPETPDATEDQGHLHIAMDAGDYDAVFSSSFVFRRGPLNASSSYATQGTKSLLVTLQANDHTDRDDLEFWDSVVEYKVVDNFGCFDL